MEKNEKRFYRSELMVNGPFTSNDTDIDIGVDNGNGTFTVSATTYTSIGPNHTMFRNVWICGTSDVSISKGFGTRTESELTNLATDLLGKTYCGKGT